MDEKESIREVIEKYKAIYQKLQPVYSPALNEKVFFNMSGFKHLVFKKHHRRNNKVIYSRMVLVPLIKPVIKKCKKETETRYNSETIKSQRMRVTYKALEATVGKSSARIKVVVRKNGVKGKYYFQSIMKY